MNTSATSSQTQGVKTLLGNPKKGHPQACLPMVAAVSAHTIYNLTDAIWVSGQDPESLSAVGFTFPFLFLAMAVANGIGIGGGSAISRRIGARDKAGADLIASHSFVVMLIFAGLFTLAMLLLARPALAGRCLLSGGWKAGNEFGPGAGREVFHA